MARRALSLKVMSALVALSMTAAPFAADAQYYGGRHDRDGWSEREYRDGGPGYRDGRGYRDGPGRHDRRGRPDRHRCHDGTTGTIIGAIAGGLLGNAVAGYGDRTAGTIIGGGVGALAGNAVGRDC
ncbi:glycine zipper 2TM domain-containing protein [Sphingomonas sp. PR090111-T3T-6A]|uniref:glycine zipper 2TM domain-containing protein n=1 Tax=Sphingomonas sp. PR090111-T3T-6A TaxID=685778 RepID=UPI000378BB88|nr:glycine zipper 2TM domain-containing protein [Sphingomonas sp. PR090111-T3T-6A]